MKICKFAILLLSMALVAWSCNRSGVDQQSVEDEQATAGSADEMTEGEGSGSSATQRSKRRAVARHLEPSNFPDEKVEPELNLTQDEWRERLTDKEFEILRQSGTERAFTGELLGNETEGLYTCAGCGEPLYSSEHKFKSNTGWPSYYTKVEGSTASEVVDRSLGMERIEIYCKHCGGHLGHVFSDGPEPTGLRHCINSAAMDFEPRDMNGDGKIAGKK